MSEAHTVGQEVDVIGEIIGHEYDATVKQLRSLCGTALLTEVVMAADEQLAVHHESGEAGSNEVFVLTHRVIDDDTSLVEKFTIGTSPADLLGISKLEVSELKRVENTKSPNYSCSARATEIRLQMILPQKTKWMIYPS
jgi:hypothetical protein